MAGWWGSSDDAEEAVSGGFTAFWKSWLGTQSREFKSQSEAVEYAEKRDGWVEDDRGRTVYEVW